jgi:hypothetical protein
METLIAKNGIRDKWYPQPVEYYKSSIIIPYNTTQNRRLNSNFAYNMQYIEYIEKQIDELNLSEVLYTMLYKSYIITGMGIIELLFGYLLRSTGNWKTTEWDLLESIIANPQKVNGVETKVETNLYTKVPSHDERMDLDSMIKKIEKRNLLSINHDAFPALKKLRELRNRVHLQLGEDATDHDYNNFGFEEIQMMRRILYAVLITPELCVNADTFKFINDSYQKRLR